MTRADIILIACVIALLPALYVELWFGNGEAEAAIVRAPDIEPIRLPLEHDLTQVVHGRLGDSTLEIRAGRIRFVDSPCRNRVCILSGWHHHAGELIACLPNRVSVELVGGTRRYDGISF
jgi:hypothetical protein